MKLGLRIGIAQSYGSAWLRGKVAALFCLLAAPVWAGDTVSVLALGDSLTQGYGLPEQDGLVPQLQGWLQEAGQDVQLINGGVSGDTSAGGAARVDWALTPEVDAMIVTLGANDFLRGIAPEVTRGNIETILQAAQARGLPVLVIGMRAPGNFGPEYKQDFDAIYPDLSDAYGTLYFDHFFSGLGTGSPAELQTYFQADGLHPSAQGITQIAAAIGPAVLELIEQTGK